MRSRNHSSSRVTANALPREALPYLPEGGYLLFEAPNPREPGLGVSLRLEGAGHLLEAGGVAPSGEVVVHALFRAVRGVGQVDHEHAPPTGLKVAHESS